MKPSQNSDESFSKWLVRPNALYEMIFGKISKSVLDKVCSISELN